MARMTAPKSGAKIRMYRQGHGDCFLLAFAPKTKKARPVYMLIDCGYKPGSQIVRHGKKVTASRVVKDIAAATGKKIDVIVVTHEHQDHVNGLGKFKDFEFGEAWFAWTEDPDDEDANDFRRRHKDQLLGLLGARHALKLAAAAGDGGASDTVSRMDELLALELGNDADDNGEDASDDAILSGLNIATVFGARAKDPLKSANKKAMKLIKERAGQRLRFISPHGDILTPGNARNVRIYPLGPPRDETMLADEDPRGKENFPGHGAAPSFSFFSAALRYLPAGEEGGPGDGAMAINETPFSPRFGQAVDEALASKEGFGGRIYGRSGPAQARDGTEVPAGEAWRRIDEEWLFAAEDFALKLNRGINNTSLVLAVELTKSGKVLLLTGDAQRGNWKSWDDGSFKVNGKTRTAKQLLANTVVYKAGHHGSHNATLHGGPDSDYPNLGWMGRGKFASEFTVFITAHRHWAINKKGKWDHPFPLIKEALLKKSGGRLFQTDEDCPEKPEGVSQLDWDSFMDNGKVKCTDLYFELTVTDT